ncbi:MAG TPA: phosphopentomutase [Solirubrobacteraceae bacterium]|nr:phosphopentomutase [Solirubrobacteraceae bacterium]
MSGGARRTFVIVLDACGAGAAPDAETYGDAGTDTLGHVARRAGGLDLPVLGRLGLGSILSLVGVAPAREPVLHGRLAPQGPGKDSTSGHWELMGVVAAEPAPTYPQGFPPAVLDALREAIGCADLLCNRPYNGLDAIDDFAAEHLRTGHPILYTSQDSVLQLAAHTDVLGEEALHAACAAARAVLIGEHAVGRVIARPFAGAPGAFARTEGRRDFSVVPPGPSYLDAVREAGVPVHAVGKTYDLFAGRGFDHAHPGATNAAALQATGRLIDELEAGLVFTNLVETDQRFGHRKDVEGFHGALRTIDAEVGRWLGRLGEDDLLVLSADHGCDPLARHSDHTREHAPLLAVFSGHGGRRHDGMLADVGASVLAWLGGGRTEPALPGRSFLPGGARPC